MAINDMYQVKLSGSYLGNNWNNVWWYRQTGGAANQAGDLWGAVNTLMMDDFSAFHNTDVLYDELSVINYGSPADSVLAAPTATVGLRAGTSDPAPSFLTATIRWNRNGPGTRYSFMRLCGCLEEDFDGNALDSVAIGLATDVGLAVTNGVSVSADTWQRVQVRSPHTLGVNPTLNFPLFTGGISISLGTQNSRKP